MAVSQKPNRGCVWGAWVVVVLWFWGWGGAMAVDEVLSEEKQKAIWEAERVTFQIENRFAPGFLGDWEKRDTRALGAHFEEGARTLSLLSGGSETVREKNGATERIREAVAGEPVQQLAREVLIGGLVKALAPIERVHARGLRVLGIERGPEGGWSAEILLTARGQGHGGKPVALDLTQQVLFKFAEDSEGEIPSIASWENRSSRLREAPGALMEEVTEACGLAELPLADNWLLPAGEMPQKFRFQFAVEDFDQDGFLDIAVATAEGSAGLLRSVGGERFEMAAAELGIAPASQERDRMLACWFDIDNDGDPDLLLGDRLYRNEAGQRFTDITDASGLYFPQRQMGAAVADADGDGLLDLYVLYQYSAESGAKLERLPWVGDNHSGSQNSLWRNLGGGKFEEVTRASKSSCGMRNSFAATWFHADDDLLPDLYVANDFGENNLLKNLGDGTFEDITRDSGTGDFATSMGVVAGDIDNDGRSELYVANMYSKMGRRIIGQVTPQDYRPETYAQILGSCAGNRLYRRGADGSYSEHGEPWGIHDVGWAHAPAMADFDNDGLLDLYATTGFLSFERGEPDG